MVLIVLVTTSLSFAQQPTKKELKEARKMEQQKKVETLVAGEKFIFEANRAFPMGYRSIDLTTNPNSISFTPDVIKSDMPFFGRATGSISYGGGEGGLKFQGAPEEFSITKEKKKYLLKAKVKDKNDSYTIQLTIFFDGGASLVINSNNRASISYNGSISKFKE
ncbi:hypothetical protein FLB_11640 [Flavobacterium succinicans]|uniref:DUF4251 domain-containing protein n=1 Tax=Flavobacterium succinicans TaxID=29536 RepID=A0A199XSE5_9FLAO|nr:hypothetical protein FLB_11640 [Flavobacterium succinicans]